MPGFGQPLLLRRRRPPLLRRPLCCKQLLGRERRLQAVASIARALVPLRGGEVEPDASPGLVDGDALAVAVHHAETVLRLGVVLLRGLLLPLDSPREVLQRAAPGFADAAERVRRVRVSLLIDGEQCRGQRRFPAVVAKGWRTDGGRLRAPRRHTVTAAKRKTEDERQQKEALATREHRQGQRQLARSVLLTS